VTVCAAAALICAALIHVALSRRLLGHAALFLIPVLGTALSCGVMAPLRLFLKNFLRNNGTFQNFITIAIVFTAGLVVYLIWILFLRRHLLRVMLPHDGA
jgi:hypothetical protein